MGIEVGILQGGNLTIRARGYRRPAGLSKFDSKVVCDSASWLGRWFSKQDMDQANLLALWKVRV